VGGRADSVANGENDILSGEHGAER
jgi:hypothetical protein